MTTHIGNRPVSSIAAFNGDELALIFGTYLSDPAFVIDCDRGRVVAGNERFQLLVGLEPSESDLLDFSWHQALHPEDRSAFDAWLRAAALNQQGNFQDQLEVRLLSQTSGEIPIIVTLHNLRWKQESYLLGFIKDVSAQHKREAQLRRQFQEQKARAIEAIKSSLCVYEFTERIKSTPVLTARLLNVENEEQLFQEAAKVLTSEDGLNYRDVAFLILEAGFLNVVFSTRPVEQKSYCVTEDNRYSQFIRKSFNSGDSTECEILVPLRSRGHLVGICEVLPYPREKVFFDESAKVAQWQKDVLLTVGDIIALLIDNLRLTREIRRQSIIDPLTETYNRHYFVGRLTSEIQRANRYGRPISTLFLDVDEFKRINDRFGHLQGDQILKELGLVFTKNLRQTDVVCRYGGDEFIALLPETDEAMARETAEKLLEAVRLHTFRNLEDPQGVVPISVSIGLSTLEPGENADHFLKGADEALYAAKQRGRDRLGIRSQRTSSSSSSSS